MVLSFTTSVDIAVGRGARVWPLPWSAGAEEAADAAVRLARGGPIAVIPAGERWGHVGALRPAIEDYLGAGAIAARIDTLTGGGSPEARMAIVALDALADRVPKVITECVSGRELAALGFGRDVELAVERDAGAMVPVLDAGVYRRMSTDRYDSTR